MDDTAGKMRREPSPVDDIAVLVLSAKDLTGIWSNDRYREIVIDPSRLDVSIAGRHITDFSPVLGATKVPMMERVAESGEPESGTDYLWDPGGHPRTFRWICYRPREDILLVLIICQSEPEPPSA